MNHTCSRPLGFAIILAFLFTTVIRGDGAILFQNDLDTITVPGQTVLGGQATYEVVLIPLAPPNHMGLVFNAHQFVYQDKQLRASTGLVWGYSAGLTGFPELKANHAFDSSCWHHIAYVYDGQQERIYIDGELAVSRASTGNIGDCNGNSSDPCNEAVGSNFRYDGGCCSVWRPGFVGYMTSLRISSVARYAGPSFCPTFGDLPNEPGTILLYNFNEGPGATVTADESGSNRHGHLGRPNLTHQPVFVDDPTTGDVTCDGSVNSEDLASLLAHWANAVVAKT